MEMIKSVVKQFYPLLIILSCVLFVVGIFFSTTINGEKGVLAGAGTVFAPIVTSDEVKNDGISYVGSAGYVPVIKYSSGAQKTGENVVFKSLLTVTKEDGTIVSGRIEDDFAIYLLDIRSPNGESVLETLSTEEITEMEEIPASFVYDKEQDKLYFFGSGVYTVYVKIYGISGGQATYEFQLPVETM